MALTVHLRGQLNHRPWRRAAGAKRPRAADFNLTAIRWINIGKVSGSEFGLNSEVICKSFRNVTGVPSGRPNRVVPGEIERISDLFKEDKDGRW